MQNKTAILVFANSAREEIKHKSIPNGYALFNGLTAHTLKTVKKTNLPFFHCTEQEQWGNSFGERFLNAIKWVFNQGYQNIITIGNDTPQLTASLIINTHLQLTHNRTVLGPSSDGGFYLMGFHKSLIKSIGEKQFKNLPWKKASLNKTLNNLLKLKTRETVSLPNLHDLDTLADIKKLIEKKTTLPKKIINLLNTLFRKAFKISVLPLQLTQLYFLKYYFNKGSPIQNISWI
ncbi:TIGR04282 family arsenosugar biosynthesis glycosyltransferase [Arenibacter latericius]|uniref:TIGR04282 family arsenosugar biosynthesis glycosyltransferase n=1 Tax=Arenibacter latericius TaxID=86104 RepID=UPI00041345CB|nr:DUF2064 domain-containing protein [Arenibacter latericius]MDX1364522.1 DUF2064 domain-containing protein [Arenibacter latericius]